MKTGSSNNRVVLVHPLVRRIPPGLRTTIELLLDRGWDAHLLFDAVDPPHSPRGYHLEDPALRGRLHHPVPRRAAFRWHHRPDPGGSLRAIDPAVVHWFSAEHARLRLETVAAPNSQTIVRFGSREAASGLRTPHFYRAVWQRADVVHVPDEGVLAALRRRGCPDDAPVLALPGLVPAKLFAMPPAAVASGTEFRVVSFAPLDWMSGYEYGATALASLQARGVRVRWEVFGEGPSLTALLYACRQLGLGNCVRVQPPPPPEILGRAIQSAHAFLAPGVIDGVTSTVLWALAVGLPVVLSDPGEMNGFLPRGAALVVPRRDPEALASALGRLAEDPGLRSRVGEVARRWAQSELGLQGHGDELSARYVELADGVGSREAQDPANDRITV